MLHSIYFLIQCFNQNYLLADSVEYLQEAENIREQFYFYCGDINGALNSDLLTKRTPAYPLVLAALQFISKSFWLITLFQIFLTFLNLWMLFKTLKLFDISINYLLILFLLIATPSFFMYSNMVMSEIFFQTSITACFYFFAHYIKEQNHFHLLKYVVCIILAMLIKPAFYLFAYFNIGLAIFYFIKMKKYELLVLPLIPIAFVLLFSLFNQQRTGHFHFSSISKINALNYNSYYFLMAKEGAQKAEVMVDQIHEQAKGIKDYNEQSKFIKSKTKEILVANFFAYGWYHAKGSVLFFLDPGRFDLANFFGIEKSSSEGLLHQKNKTGGSGVIDKLKQQPLLLLFSLVFIFGMNMLKFLGLIWFAFIRSIPIELKILCLGIIFYLAFLTGPLGASRFALPVFILVLFAWQMIWSSLCSNNLKT